MTSILETGNISTFSPHMTNTTAYEQLMNQTTGNPDLDVILGHWDHYASILANVFISVIGAGPFWMLLWGTVGLVLFWRTRSPFIPSVLLLITSPIIWSQISGAWRAPLIGIVCLSMVGVVYSFVMSAKKA